MKINYEDETTVAGFLHKKLVENGLFPVQATGVMEMILPDDAFCSLHEVLHKKIEGYPDVFKAVAWMTVKNLAVEWIDENMPSHWARSMFVGKP